MKYLETVKEWLETSDALVVNTGAGMGVDSGLPDYRGEGGQWGEVEGQTDKRIFEVVNPKSFIENPAFSWGLFGQRVHDYETTEPHEGYYILKRWVSEYDLDFFGLTSNIDGHFQKAGFPDDRIRELHGSLSYFQGSEKKGGIWKNTLSGKEILDSVAKGIYPLSPYDGGPARPNVYMFRDNTYIDTRSKEQKARFEEFLERNNGKRLMVFEIGSGPHVQTVRIKTRMLRADFGARVVRINPKEFGIKPPNIGIAKGALAALKEIDAYLSNNIN